MLEKKAQDTTHFGFREVPAKRKDDLVRSVFDSVAERYDLMNDLMSAGIHRLWKARLIAWLNPRPGLGLLDIAGGTGDIALRALERSQERGSDADRAATITVCDTNPTMLELGRDRAIDRGIIDGITWTAGNAEALPFSDNSFDAVTVAFGIRNVTRIDRALAEAYRVLRPGGHFLCLEFSRTVLPGLQHIYDLYSFAVLPQLGHIITGDREAYQYLVESIRRFPEQNAFAEMATTAGFTTVRYLNLTGGIAAIHSGWRI
tara:strand:+ start:283 stop:1062 length:780 start_codon:yes stop_codon:yes gene_type:complete